MQNTKSRKTRYKFSGNKKIMPKLVGGIGNKWGKQFHQQNRIYDSNYIAMCIPASLTTNSNGGGYWYLVYEEK